MVDKAKHDIVREGVCWAIKIVCGPLPILGIQLKHFKQEQH